MEGKRFVELKKMLMFLNDAYRNPYSKVGVKNKSTLSTRI